MFYIWAFSVLWKGKKNENFSKQSNDPTQEIMLFHWLFFFPSDWGNKQDLKKKEMIRKRQALGMDF